MQAKSSSFFPSYCLQSCAHTHTLSLSLSPSISLSLLLLPLWSSLLLPSLSLLVPQSTNLLYLFLNFVSLLTSLLSSILPFLPLLSPSTTITTLDDVGEWINTHFVTIKKQTNFTSQIKSIAHPLTEKKRL
jgi:hypothetical protein